ncbi:hypothetical protein V6C27_00785 [Peptococcaceae bacterium 1198_IL3148]
MLYVDKNEVLRYLGYKPNSTKFTPDMLAKIDYYISLGITLLEPNTTYRIFNHLDITDRGVEIAEAGLVLPGNDISNLLRNAKKVCLVAATIGPQLEAKVSQLFKSNEYAAGTILDAVGSDAVEKVADQLQEQLKLKAKKQGYHLTWRYCSGYGDLPLEVNRPFAKIVNAASIGINITETCALQPEKSIFGIVGFTVGEQDVPILNKCANCGAENCAYRNRGEMCAKTSRNTKE